MFKRTATVALMILAAACSSDVRDEQPNKATVSQAIGQGEDLGDVCAEHGWYGDGECDSFCSSHDEADCSGTTVACAEFIESPDGVCSRPADDPCLFQDPDCSDEPVACPAIAMEPNGVCELPDSDPCQFIDPDCAGDDDIACPALYSPPDGVCSLPDSDPCQFIDADCPQPGDDDPSTPPDDGGGSVPGSPGSSDGSEPDPPGNSD
jgi:hypothetical protein